MTIAVVVAAVLFVGVLAASVRIAGEHERAVVLRLGRVLPELKGPGLVLLVPLVDRTIKIDLRTQTVADRIGAERWLLGKAGVVDSEGRVVVEGQPWRARSENGTNLGPGAHVQVKDIENDLRLVVGSMTSPIEEGTT